MSCTNCFNGCADTVSDQCVKYTGIDIPALGIENGDQLSSVENAITTFLSAAIVGTGIKPIIDEDDICAIVSNYLPVCTECNGFTLNELLTAIIKATCDIQTQVTTNTNAITALNANYTIGCLTGVTAASDTHDIVQAVINNLCSLNSSFSALLLSLPLTYVSIANINTYIANYLTSQSFLAKAKDRMIPYSPIPYVGNLSNYPASGDSFNLSGVGTGYWDKVYLCNGQNGTPDLRGRVLPGVVTGMGGGVYNAAVDPANPQNPNYTLGTIYGANSVTLGIGQMPAHDHPGSTVSIVETPHYHNVANGETGTEILIEDTPYLSYYGANGGGSSYNSYYFKGTDDVPDRGRTSSVSTGITASPNIASQGGGGAHNNVQPVYATYYIIYIP
jgi:microcystin-dependent protein